MFQLSTNVLKQNLWTSQISLYPSRFTLKLLTKSLAMPSNHTLSHPPLSIFTTIILVPVTILSHPEYSTDFSTISVFSALALLQTTLHNVVRIIFEMEMGQGNPLQEICKWISTSLRIKSKFLFTYNPKGLLAHSSKSTSCSNTSLITE